jgi:DNA-binding NtrC family response regulator
VISVPPLRQRREDVPGLVRLLLRGIATRSGMRPVDVTDQALDLLTALPWKGNLTELELLLRRLAARAPGRRIRLADVLAHVRLDGQPAAGYGGTLREARESFERDYVAAVLDQHRGRMAEAARALGLQRTNLYRKVRQLSVRRRVKRPLS